MCKKRKYSRQGALFAIIKAQRDFREGKIKADRVPVRSYFCKHCKTYHLTSQLRFSIKKGVFKGSQDKRYGRL